jgi:coenzyme F420-reducing hydrogenase gamma subunit
MKNKKDKKIKKDIKLAVFDLTDCEGCELQFLTLREELAKRGQDFTIANWRLLSDVGDPGPFDVTFIEGSPITEDDIEVVKRARAVSDKIITLGICAVLGGVQAALPANARAKNLQKVYGKKYKTTSKPPKPVSYYIDVDVDIPGCPVNPQELESLLSALFAGKEFKEAKYPVCLECKAAGNTCLFLEDGFCMGPVTKGGCGAPCPSPGQRCYGCFGPVAGANLKAMENVAGKYTDKKYLKDNMELYFKESEEYKEYKTRKK